MDRRVLFPAIGFILFALFMGMSQSDYIILESEGTGTFASNLSGITTGYFTYLLEDSNITIASGDTWYNITGNFTADPIVSFTEDAATDSFTYTYSETAYYEIDWHAAFQTSANNNCYDITVAVNGVPINDSQMCTYLKNHNENYGLSGTTVAELSQGDVVNYVIKSSTGSSNALFEHFTSTVRPFGGDNWKGLPENSTYDYDSSSRLVNITDTFDNMVVDTTISYNNDSQIETVIIVNPVSGTDTINFTYNNSLLQEVIYS